MLAVNYDRSLFLFSTHLSFSPIAHSHFNYAKGSGRQCEMRSLPKASPEGHGQDSNHGPLELWPEAQDNCSHFGHVS